MSDGNQEHASVEIDGVPFDVVRVSGREALSEFFCYDVVCAPVTVDYSLKTLLGAEVLITLRDGFGAHRSIRGIITDAERQVFDDGGVHVSMTIRPGSWVLTLGNNCRVFQNLTTPQIVQKVLDGAPALARGKAGAEVPVRWALTATYAPHVYCAQYREDDWTFISRLLEEEGIYCWFDHQDGCSTLVFSDDSTLAPDLVGGARMPFSYETGLNRAQESILVLGGRAGVAPGQFNVGSFNPGNPKVKVQGGTGQGSLEVYSARGGGSGSSDECGRMARFLGEAASAGAKGAHGKAMSVRLVPGMIVDIWGHPHASLEGRHLVVESMYSVVQRRKGEHHKAAADVRSFECHFRVLPEKVKFRRARVTPLAKQPGLQIGTVVGPHGAEVHPNADGAVRVQHHWDREGKKDEHSGKWMRVAQRGTADSMLLPRIGWNVATFHEEGEIDAPSILSRFHDAEHPPAYSLPDNKTRVVYKTATTPGGGSFNEIRYEDKAGVEEMLLHASKDMQSLVKNDHDEKVFHDRRRLIEHDHTFEIGANYVDVVKRDQNIQIGKDETIKVDGNTEKIVTGNEENVILGKRSLHVGGKHADLVEKTRKLSVGSAQMDITLGTISSIAKTTSILVGGAMIRATASSMQEAGGWVSVQTIGGAKIELVRKSRVTQVKGYCFETVGGMMNLTAGKTYTDKSSKSSTWTAGAAMNSTAPTIVIQAKKKITLQVGASSVTIEDAKVTIETVDLTLSQSPANVVNTLLAKHN